MNFFTHNGPGEVNPLHWDELFKSMPCPDCGLSCQSVDACKAWQDELRKIRERAIKIIGR